MFAKEYESDNKVFCLYLIISCVGKKKLKVWAEDYGKPNSKYANREIIVDGKRTIHFNFPVSPKKLYIGVANVDNEADNDFQVVLMESELKTYNVWLDSETSDFLKLSSQFSQVAGFTNAPPNGRIFQTDDKQFTIKYYDVIRDNMSGKPLNTPARIGHRSGIIETAKIKFDAYTIPMRMIILLHEFSHKYKNPKIGLEISNETGADINALYIYLGLGFSKIDAICVFANVFLKAQTQGNIERMRKIMDYIQRFENQEFATLN
tara:strand:- start:132 stop:920 length:789 start_codon:yes stop_codon:yes gene_type:complete